ncbi:unnamed protein product [Cyprideis torosa]|uniref:furin n=1 Tax=Cyprideis torosa TaxID=163714 RepID=A0A7R8ZG99_9CRUS|nr:unnamed protein product [Cyprideis torosa]CAG0879561.1 unnamed protein product [Cyprideis torosa]
MEFYRLIVSWVMMINLVHFSNPSWVEDILSNEIRKLDHVEDNTKGFLGLFPLMQTQPRLSLPNRLSKTRQKSASAKRTRLFAGSGIGSVPEDFEDEGDEYNVCLNDPRWTHMWYLHRITDADMNIVPAWSENVTGRGIVVSILDDGLEHDHPDIIDNYDPDASFDFNSHDADPMPRYDLLDSNRHGTRCAGEVAAKANNSFCGVGVAFNSWIGGVRMLDGEVTDLIEAKSLSLNNQHVDIYSASWGPDDDGKTVDGPGPMASAAFIEGITKGRDGKGSVFVWASGNGGREHDNCNCDGYTNSIWTLSVSSVSENGYVPWYSEACSSTFATTYSSGASTERQVITTDLHHGCTNFHTGTSASAPIAAGIVALTLEANPDLTWRDLQHLVIRTSRKASLRADDWHTNAGGRWVSHFFGYGLLDGWGMVRLARRWQGAPRQERCAIPVASVSQMIPAKSQIDLHLEVSDDDCINVNFLEHVQSKVTFSASRRGDIQMYLISPMGTRSMLLGLRPHDASRAGFNAWPFMTVHSWGESPVGIWQLEVHNEGRYMAHLTAWTLLLYGTAVSPDDQTYCTGWDKYGNCKQFKNN